VLVLPQTDSIASGFYLYPPITRNHVTLSRAS